jgi:hypothetical protein
LNLFNLAGLSGVRWRNFRPFSNGPKPGLQRAKKRIFVKNRFFRP